MKTISFDIKNFEFGLIKYSKFELLKVHIKPSGCKYVGIYKKISLQFAASIPLLLDWMKGEYLLELPI